MRKTPDIDGATGLAALNEEMQLDWETVLLAIAKAHIRLYRSEWDWSSDPGLPNLVYRPYYMGDCDCGYDEAYLQWEAANSHRSHCFQTRLDEMVREYGEGKIEALARRLLREMRFETTAPFRLICTCDLDNRFKDFERKFGSECSPLCSTQLPNLEFDGVKVFWYKRPNRAVRIDRSMTGKQWEDWVRKLRDAVSSVSTVEA